MIHTPGVPHHTIPVLPTTTQHPHLPTPCPHTQADHDLCPALVTIHNLSSLAVAQKDFEGLYRGVEFTIYQSVWTG
jgi:hypothetical protein